MSYHQLCSSAGLGFDWNDTKQEGISTVTQANADYVTQAIDKMSVPAFAAGPISKAEQDAVGLILERGSAGKLPTPSQISGILQTAGVAVVAGAAGAACGPAAPLCAAGAAYLTSKIFSSISGSGSGCGAKINGMCSSDYWAAYRKAVLAKCPPGSQECRDRLNDLWDKKVPALLLADKVAEQDWKKRCIDPYFSTYVNKSLYGNPTPYVNNSLYGSTSPYVNTSTSGKVKFPFAKHGVPDAECYQVCPKPRKTLFGESSCVTKARSLSFPHPDAQLPSGLAPMQLHKGLPTRPNADWVMSPSGKYVSLEGTYKQTYASQEESRILLESRYKVEYDYITTVDAQTKALQDKVVPQCRTAGCKTQVKGILGEGAFEAAQLLRSPTGGKALADRAMQQAMLQANGAIQQSIQMSKMKEEAKKAKLAADMSMVKEAVSSNNTRKVILGIASVAVVATGVAVYIKRRKR